MSLVIALRKKDGNFIIGADSQTTYGDLIYHDAKKIWKMEPLGLVICNVGNGRTENLLQNNPDLFTPIVKKGEIDVKYLMTDFTKKLHEYLKSYYNHVDEKDGEYTHGIMGYGNIIIAYKNRAFCIFHDYSISEIETYKAIGCGEPVAIGCLETFLNFTNKSEEQIITETINIVSRTMDGVDRKIRIIHAD